MRPPLSYVPLLPLLAALIVGIVTARWLDGSWLMFWGVIACTALSAVLFGRRYVAVLVAAVGVGYLVSEVDAYRYRANMPHEGVHRASGLVLSVRESDMSQRYVVSLCGSYRGNCYLTVPGFYDNVKAGDIIDFTASFGRQTVNRDVGGDIDLSNFYYRNHVGGRAVVLHDSLTVTGCDRSIVWSVKRYRENLVDEITRSGMSESTQEFVAALLLGDDSLLDDDRRPQFAAAGIAHILALSGMHVAIIAGVLSWLLFPLLWVGHRRLRWVIVIVALWLYALLTGMSPSVTRAVIMFTMVLIAKSIGRHYSSANALCFAAIAILVVSPRQLFAPGFQLSFVAVFSLIVVMAALPQVSPRNRFVRAISNYMIFSVAAVLGTLPIVIYYFHRFPVYFLVANIPCSLLLPLIMVGAIIVVVLLLMGVDWGVLDMAVNRLCDVVTGTARYTAQLPGSTIDNLYIHWWGVIAAYIAVGAVVAWIYYRRRWLPAVAFAGVIFVGVSVYQSKNEPDVLFIGRSSDVTNIVYTQGSRGYMLSSAPLNRLDDERRHVMNRYAGFMGRRDIDSLTTVGVNVDGAMLVKYGRYKLVIINGNDVQSDELTADYLVVCRGFKGDIIELTDAVKCDTVLLGTDINARRRRRYETELVGVGRPVRSLSGDYGLILDRRE